MKRLTKKQMRIFAVGQLGWSTLSGIISAWFVTFYLPTQVDIQSGAIQYIVPGLVIGGFLTVLGLITALSRIFDAVTDPWIASLSDRSKNPRGRRIPFMQYAAIPLSAVTVLLFCAPVNEISSWNIVWISVFIVLFYLFMTMYCTPYNALIPELGSTQSTRMAISTSISFTYIAGMALVYVAPVIWGALETSMDRMIAMRLTFALLAVIGLICLFVPVFTIKETDYVQAAPVESTAMRSLLKTFRNGDFRRFVASDIAYFLGITMFQTALPYFVTSLLKLDESMSTVYFVLMTALSLIFYIPINKLTPKLGKKKLILTAFVIFTICFVYTASMGEHLPIPAAVQGYILCAVAAPAMAIFGILPQAVVADIAESDAIETSENRSGMFYAARTFAFKLGQSLAMLLFTAIATIRSDIGLGYRIVALSAAAVCLLGGVIFFFYNEGKVYRTIMKSDESPESR